MGHAARPNSVWEGPTQGHEKQEARVIEGHLRPATTLLFSFGGFFFFSFSTLKVKVQIPSFRNLLDQVAAQNICLWCYVKSNPEEDDKM